MKPGTARRLLLFGVALLATLLASFHYVYRPWQMNWGATSEEISRPMPGDEIVGAPNFDATRAVTVEAPAERIMPEYQGLRLGDVVPLSASSGARVALIEPPEQLLLVFQSDTAATWAWGLYPIDAGRTRLVSRLRVRLPRLAPRAMLDAFEIVMMRKHLLGIKRRAERGGGQTSRQSNNGPSNHALHPTGAGVLLGAGG